MSIKNEVEETKKMPEGAEQDQNRPEDVPDSELEAVAGGWGHERYYHHRGGRRGYWHRGTFIELNI